MSLYAQGFIKLLNLEFISFRRFSIIMLELGTPLAFEGGEEGKLKLLNALFVKFANGAVFEMIEVD